MPQPQSAICAEGEAFGLFLTLMLSKDAASAGAVRHLAAALPALTSELAAQLGEPTLVSAIGFGAGVWPRLFGSAAPAGLVSFERLADGPREAPATPADLFIHIHSARHDANFALARAVMTRLGGAVTVAEEIHGFKNQGGRDLTGFVDGTENPKGEDRPDAALVAEGDFAGGSYVSIQRYVHALDRWSHLAVSEQEGVIGRTKADDLELADDVKPASAHIARVVIEEDGEELQILRHSLPYGTTAEHGLYFVAYGASPHPFRRMLERMVLRDADGVYDRMLDFSRPVTGAAFFVPAVEMLRALA
ncbi:MAG TPA: Dyp-type peroxidase [Patescibacteria group bacterium]|nr:Dyp-type peroxidase [Patescibacteria group bacterium]